MRTLQHISMLQHLKSLSLASDRLAMLENCEESSVDLLSEAIVNIFQVFVVGINWKDGQKCKAQINWLILSKSTVASRRARSTSHECFSLLEVIPDHVLHTFCKKTYLVYFTIMELIFFVLIACSHFKSQLLSGKPKISKMYDWKLSNEEKSKLLSTIDQRKGSELF